MVLNLRISDYIHRIESKGLLRARTLVGDGHVRFDSNDYLSLTKMSEIKDAFVTGFKRYPAGSSGAMLVSGYHDIHYEFEERFASFVGAESCALFSTGYMANLAVMLLLGQLQITALIDKKCHASIYDGLKMAGVEFFRFKHNDVSDLERLLENQKNDYAIVTEGVFSMTGQQAPLHEMQPLVASQNGALIVDESHALGLLGPQGQGAGFGIQNVPLRVFPLGKAFAAQGALVAGPKAWIQALTQAARPFIYSTAMSPAYCYGLLKTLDVIVAAHDRRAALQRLVGYFQEHAKSSHFCWAESVTPIQFLHLGCPHKAQALGNYLLAEHIICTPIRSPTVSVKDTGLRVVLNYHHDVGDIRRLFEVLERFNATSH